MSVPKNTTLYNRVKKEAKEKFKVWPSAYASAWLVREYKRRGGTYSGSKPNKTSGLKRWFEEEWIDVCKLPKHVNCGRPATNLSSWKKKYPYCRPSRRVSKQTPKTASELSSYELAKRCSKKRRSPLTRVR